MSRRKDGMPRSIPGGIICGGEPTAEDLAVVQEFQAALAQPTQHLQRLAMLEMAADDPEVRAALDKHCLDPEPWVTRGIATGQTGMFRGPSEFKPRPDYCQHRECYP